MPRTRVLVVDDAVVVRRLVAQAIESDPDLEVAGVAANGRIGLARIAQLNPDVVTLDVEMPELDGLETLREIRREWPRLPVIMFSTLTERGASATLDALTFGASDYCTKPAGVSNPAEALERVKADLVPKIKALAPKAAPAGPTAPTGTTSRLPRPAPGPLPRSRVDLVALGLSTGGPNALSDLLPQLPDGFPVPMVIVQHMPPMFTRFLAERLDTRCGVSVKEGEAGDRLRPGHVYIAPGGLHMTVERDAGALVLATNEGAPENSCRPAVDVLFRSVAAACGPGVLAVVLTGMGQDGLRGSEVVREAGGRVLAQDEETSVVWGMPGFVARAGLADAVLPLGDIAGEVNRRVGAGRLRAGVA